MMMFLLELFVYSTLISGVIMTLIEISVRQICKDEYENE